MTVREYADFIESGGYEDEAFWTVAGWDWRIRRRYVEQFAAEWARKRDTLRAHPERIVRLLRDGLASPARAAALVRFMDFTDDELLRHAQANHRHPVGSPHSWETVSPLDYLNPVAGVSWFEANAFCAWKSIRTGLRVRLPSEDEWEAAWLLWRLERLPISEPINTLESGFGGTIPVGATDARHFTDFGVPKDLFGNCFEWMFDPYTPGDHIRKIVKGGSWRQEAWRAHPAYRGRGEVSFRADDAGFRYVVEDLSARSAIARLEESIDISGQVKSPWNVF